MSNNVKLQVGEEIPIVLQIADGVSTLYPRAYIYDNDNNLLGNVNLEHKANGYYAPANGSEEIMPDEFFISIVFVVYTDSGHTTESTIYLRDLDIFYKVVPDDYKAVGFSIPGEYDATLSGIQADLDNPDQYKADVSGLAQANEYDTVLSGIQSEVAGLNGEAMRGTDGAYTGTPPTVGEIDTELTNNHGSGSWLSGTTTSGEYDDRLSTIQADLDNTDQYKADVSGLALTGEYDATLSGIPAGVWDVMLDEHQIIGSTGEALSQAAVASGTGGQGITEQDKLDIADRVWDEATADHTVAGSYGEWASTVADNVVRTLGLTQENYLLYDTNYTTYSGIKLLTSGKLRTYSVAGSVGTGNDIIATYQINSTWDKDELTQYKVVKV